MRTPVLEGKEFRCVQGLVDEMSLTSKKGALFGVSEASESGILRLGDLGIWGLLGGKSSESSSFLEFPEGFLRNVRTPNVNIGLVFH